MRRVRPFEVGSVGSGHFVAAKQALNQATSFSASASLGVGLARGDVLIGDQRRVGDDIGIHMQWPKIIAKLFTALLASPRRYLPLSKVQLPATAGQSRHTGNLKPWRVRSYSRS